MERRVAIIGAGPAGLTAALRLQRLGYRHVTVYERRRRVGGKCLTVDVEGRNYELGAVIVGRTTYTMVNALLAEFGLETTPVGKTALLSTEAGGHVPPFALLKEYLTRYRPALRRYLASIEGTPAFSESGYLGFDPAAFGRGFMEWLRDHDAEAVRDVIGPMYTGFGYGYLEHASVPQVLKIYDRERLQKALAFNPFRRAPMLGIDAGYQGLWTRVAAGLNVRLDACVREIRRGAEVHVTTDAGTETYDALILACPLHKVSAALDATPEEQALFGQIRTLDYRTILAAVDGLGRRGLVFFTDNLTADRAGRLVCGYRRWKDTNIWALYVMGEGRHDDAAVMENVAADLHAVGAELKQVHRHDKWAFYPHVSPADFRAGFYPRLEALQGRNRTYFAGEIMAAASVESVAQYSSDLVHTHFGPSATAEGA